MATKSSWTILTYIAAHNNLDRLGQSSRTEIERVGSTAEVTQGLLLDTAKGASRCIVGGEEAPLGAFDSGDADALIATARWLFQQKPAERYGVVLWSHGTGWEPDEIAAVSREARPSAPAGEVESRERAAAPGSRVIFRSSLRSILRPDAPAERAILFDDGTGHSLDTLELARVAAAIAEAIGQKLDFLGMDACLMANLEVAYELRNSVRTLVASEELVPAHSWPYADIYGALRDAPRQDSGAFARVAVRKYVDYYTAHPPAGGDVAKVAVDLDRIEAVKDLVAALAKALLDDMPRAAPALWSAQRETEQRETRSGRRAPSKFDYLLWDIGSIALKLQATAGTVGQAATDLTRHLAPDAGAILQEGHLGDWFDGTAGLSVYLPPPGRQRICAAYAQLAFAKDSGWGDMLAAYHEAIG